MEILCRFVEPEPVAAGVSSLPLQQALNGKFYLPGHALLCHNDKAYWKMIMPQKFWTYDWKEFSPKCGCFGCALHAEFNNLPYEAQE